MSDKKKDYRPVFVFTVCFLLMAWIYYATHKDQWDELPYGDHPVIDTELEDLS